MRPLEEWIRRHVSLERTPSAKLRYDAMDHQAPRGLAGVYRPFDPDEIYDWVDLTLILAYLEALGTRGRLLDVGTGDGWPALPLAPYVREVVGIDLSDRRVAVSEENRARLGYANVRFAVADGTDLPFPDASFDGAVVGTALEQTDDLDKALAETHRVLRTGGALVATFEHLAVELSQNAEEEVEFFVESERFVYRYVVKEVSPPREAEYELILRPAPASRRPLELAAASFPRRPGFVRREGEPGSRPLTADVAAAYGLEFLRGAAEAVSSGRYFELDHTDRRSLEGSLRDAGFGEIQICGRITRAAHGFFIALHEAGLLRGALRPHFEATCAAFATLWPIITPEADPVLFVRARRSA